MLYKQWKTASVLCSAPLCWPSIYYRLWRAVHTEKNTAFFLGIGNQHRNDLWHEHQERESPSHSFAPFWNLGRMCLRIWMKVRLWRKHLFTIMWIIVTWTRVKLAEGFHPVERIPPVSAGDNGDMASIPGLGRSPGGGNGNPFQYSHQENPMDRGAWWAKVHGVAELDTTEQLSDWAHTYTHTWILQETEALSVIVEEDQKRLGGMQKLTNWIITKDVISRPPIWEMLKSGMRCTLRNLLKWVLPSHFFMFKST